MQYTYRYRCLTLTLVLMTPGSGFLQNRGKIGNQSCDCPHPCIIFLLRIISDVVEHHDDDIGVRNAIVLEYLIGSADASLERIVEERERLATVYNETTMMEGGTKWRTHMKIACSKREALNGGI